MSNVLPMKPRSKPHKFIFLNGPRKSGKDTAARIIATKLLNIRHRKFAGALKAAAAGMFNIDNNLFKELEKEGSDLKLRPLPELFGKSWVETLIWLSEEVMKPRYGSDIFGRILVTDLARPTASELTVISDCGFVDEVKPVIDTFGVGNCALIRLIRPGCDFGGDSRSYIALDNEYPNLYTSEIHNEHELDMFEIQVMMRVNKFLGR